VSRVIDMRKIDNHPKCIEVLVEGTEMQEKVWRALVNIQPGETRFYGDLAKEIGKPGAARAVGNAAGKNRVGYLIPCHRLLGKSNSLKFAAGPEIKRKVLEKEGN